MKRNFEQEFKDLKLNETPDLWSRIESALPEKKVAAAVLEGNTAVIDKYKVGKGSVFRKWVTLAAACLCVIIILPVLSFVIGSRGGRKSNYSDLASGSADNSATDASLGIEKDYFAADNLTEMSEAYETNDSLDGTSGSAASSFTDDTDMTCVSENAEADGSSDVIEAYESEAADAAEPSENNEEKLASSSSAADDSTKADYDLYAGLENGKIIEDIAVEILEVSILGEETVYTAVVKRADKDGIFNINTEINIMCDSDTEYDFITGPRKNQALKTAETYELSLRYEQTNSQKAESSLESGRLVVVIAKKN